MIRLYLDIRYYFYRRNNLVSMTFNEWLLWEYGICENRIPRKNTVMDISTMGRRKR